MIYLKDKSGKSPLAYAEIYDESGRLLFCSSTSLCDLIRRGAGIGCQDALPALNLAKLKPQLFVGASAVFTATHQQNLDNHIFSYRDILRLIRQNILTIDDIRRIADQAQHGIIYGRFSNDILNELHKICRILKMTEYLNSHQLYAYAEYEVEFLIMVLQVMPQLAELCFPIELSLDILIKLSGLDDRDNKELITEIIREKDKNLMKYCMRL
jgi:hypothetical protein